MITEITIKNKVYSSTLNEEYPSLAISYKLDGTSYIIHLLFNVGAYWESYVNQLAKDIKTHLYGCKQEAINLIRDLYSFVENYHPNTRCVQCSRLDIIGPEPLKFWALFDISKNI